MHKCHQATPPKHDANACEMVKTKIRSYREKGKAIMGVLADAKLWNSMGPTLSELEHIHQTGQTATAFP